MCIDPMAEINNGFESTVVLGDGSGFCSQQGQLAQDGAGRLAAGIRF